MSKIMFITSEKPINLKRFGINLIEKSEYLLSIFPCLKDKNYIYDFEGFNKSVSYKEFINLLIDQVEENNNVVFLVLEETINAKEIKEYNEHVKNKNVINIKQDDKLIYDLIYRLERDSLLTSSEYSFINL